MLTVQILFSFFLSFLFCLLESLKNQSLVSFHFLCILFFHSTACLTIHYLLTHNPWLRGWLDRVKISHLYHGIRRL